MKQLTFVYQDSSHSQSFETPLLAVWSTIMPPKQKKKALKKPVNRGFATTSIPKKVVEPEPSLDDQDTAQDEHEAPDSLQALAGPNAKVESDAKRHGIDGEDADGSKDFIPAQDEWDLEAEDRELQSLAEKLRPVCEKEIGKQIKVNILPL